MANELKQYLIENGIEESDAETLDELWGTVSPEAFLDGLRKVAAIIYLEQPPAPPDPDTEPWRTLHQVLSQVGPGNTANEFGKALERFDAPAQMAISGAISRVTSELAGQYQRVNSPSKMGSRRANLICNPILESPDGNLKMQINEWLSKDKINRLYKTQAAEALLLNWMTANGKFVRTPEDHLYYLWRAKHKLFELDSDRFQSWLHVLCGVNPASNEFKALFQTCRTAAYLHGEAIPVVRFAYWDTDNRILRVSQFDGRVYLLDGEQIYEESNGDGPVLFDDQVGWMPYEPDYDDCERVMMTPLKVPEWKDACHEWATFVWILSLFFPEFCPVKPLTIFLGEKGSGKSMTLRMILRLLFGPFSQVNSIPNKPDAFMVMAHHNYVVAMDNFDNYQDWMRDKLAGISTGMEDQLRTLYTTKAMTTIRYRCWMAMTARTPDTLRRDDLADRLLILPLERIPDDRRRREAIFLQEVDRMRGKWWGGILKELNQIVKQMQLGAVPDFSSLRLADWEVFGKIVSMVHGKEDEWKKIVGILKAQQNEFLVEGNVVLEGLQRWLENPTNINRAVRGRDLYHECAQALFIGVAPDHDWPKSVMSFIKRLMNTSEYLKQRYSMTTWEDRTAKWYKFAKA